jgi:hypothetical protein
MRYPLLKEVVNAKQAKVSTQDAVLICNAPIPGGKDPFRNAKGHIDVH